MIVVEVGGKVNPKRFIQGKRKVAVDKIYHFLPKSSVILEQVVINLCVEMSQGRKGIIDETK